MKNYLKRFLSGWCAALLLATGFSVPTMARADTITYYHNDFLGSPVVATNSAGAVLWRQTYKPYGERMANEEGSFGNKIRYTSRHEDDDTELVYMGARYYDPVVGRFTALDPLRFDETNVHSFNRYAYANGNPLKFKDPDGNAAETVWDLVSFGISVAMFKHDPTVANFLGAAVDGVALVVPFVPGGIGMIRMTGKGVDAATEAAEAGMLYRSGAGNPGNLKTRPGEEGVSFRDSLSNPIDAKNAPVFKPGDSYVEIDAARLPVDSVVRDGVPAGHVTVRASPQEIKDAMVHKGKLPR